LKSKPAKKLLALLKIAALLKIQGIMNCVFLVTKLLSLFLIKHSNDASQLYTKALLCFPWSYFFAHSRMGVSKRPDPKMVEWRPVIEL
jgi:hypothetical protein